MTKTNWFKKNITLKRVLTSMKFSVIVGVTYWATTVYESAFKQGSVISVFLAWLLVASILLLFGGSLLDAMSKE